MTLLEDRKIGGVYVSAIFMFINEKPGLHAPACVPTDATIM